MNCNVQQQEEIVDGATVKMANGDKDVGWRIVIQVVVCLVVGIPLAIFRFAVIPFRRGYFCDDDSIRLNFKESTVSSLALYFVGTLLPATVFVAVEYTRYRRGHSPATNNSYTVFGFPIHPLIVVLLDTLFYFAFACITSQLITDVAKYTIGRLRPHFLDVCKSTYPCDMQHPHVYIQDYECTGDESMVREARLSFPSGHSSFSSVTMVYLILYIQLRVKINDLPLLKPFLQFLCLLVTIYTGLSRISDHKHHWSDVLAGFAIGTSVAVIVVFAISDLYMPKHRQKIDPAVFPLSPQGDC